MLSANKVVHAEDTCTSVTGFICAKCQNYNICMNRFNTSFCTKDHKTHKAIYCYTLLLHQAARGEGKKGYFSFWSWSTTIFHHYNNLILIYNVLSSYRLYYVQFKKLKFYGVWGPEAGGWIIQTPCLRNVFILYISRSSTFLRSNLNICIVYQSFRTILLLNTSEVSNFTENTCARVSFFQ